MMGACQHVPSPRASRGPQSWQAGSLEESAGLRRCHRRRKEHPKNFLGLFPWEECENERAVCLDGSSCAGPRVAASRAEMGSNWAMVETSSSCWTQTLHLTLANLYLHRGNKNSEASVSTGTEGGSNPTVLEFITQSTVKLKINQTHLL